jgi:hypothetical protein|tara:strand:+ start:2021 stop:2278 length:258 start_codon:yes stop_codon:yes gene_type:complete
MSTTTNYKLQKGPDNITWCSLEPLMRDLIESIKILNDMDLPLHEESDRNNKIMGIKAAYEILAALVNEANRTQLLEKNNVQKTTH